VRPTIVTMWQGLRQAIRRGGTGRRPVPPQTRMVSEGQLTVQAVPLRENAAGLELVTPFQVPLKPNPV
jgi:hypothetical protein